MQSIGAALIALAGGLCGYNLAHDEPPHCPTEDSCQPQYEDGEWTIVEVTP